jgi:hypothetical protein
LAKAAMKKSDKRDWIWLQSAVNKDKWALDHIPAGDIHAPYIKRMSKNSDGSYSYYVYRNQKCIGSIKGKDQERCLNECRKRAQEGKIPDHVIESDKRLQAYVNDKNRDVNVFKKFTEEEQAWIANVYPWAMPKKSELDAKKIKVKVTRDDLMSKGEKKAAAMATELPMDSKIIRERDGNPKKEGSPPWKRWQTMFSYADGGKTVGEYVKDGGNPTTLKNAVLQGWVKVKGMK